MKTKKYGGGLTAYIALGSNVGNRRKNIAFGIAELSKLGEVAPSPLVMETEDEGGAGPPYLNTVARLQTHIESPQALLEEALRIELRCGRDRSLPPKSPRELDLDIIMAEGWRGSWEWASPEDLSQLGPRLTLILPHPRAGAREFVAKPLEALLPGAAVMMGFEITSSDKLKRPVIFSSQP